MVRPSKPKLMARVLEAVTLLAEGKGSLTRDVLCFVKQTLTGSKRNLTMQVQRALKHAVNAGLLSCKSGRYKMQLALNPISRQQASKRHRHEGADSLKNVEVLDEINDEPPIGGTDPSRKVQDRQKLSRRKRSARRNRRRSATRSARRKPTKRYSTRMRRVSKRSRRRRNDDEIDEDWPTRRRRMMAKPKYEDDDEDDDEEEEEDEGMRYTRDGRKMKSTNEDSASYVSGDSNSIGRHRSRRSKHLTKDRRSPSRRANGDTEGPRKSTRRSTSRRRNQQNQRETRRESDPEEAAEQVEGLDEEHEHEDMEQDEDQENVERDGPPPEENQGAE